MSYVSVVCIIGYVICFAVGLGDYVYLIDLLYIIYVIIWNSFKIDMS